MDVNGINAVMGRINAIQQRIDAIDTFSSNLAKRLNPGQESSGKGAGFQSVLDEAVKRQDMKAKQREDINRPLAQAGKATIVPFVTARDHKRLLDGARGPNTGGMGAIAPVADVTAQQLEAFQKTILQPTLQGMIAEGMDYRGFIFFGISIFRYTRKFII